MSLAIAFCTPHGIVMSADRCITSVTSDGKNYCLTMQERKLFLSSEGYAFSYTGSASFNNHSASYWMDRFIARFSNANLSVSDFTRKLCIAFHSLDSTKNITIIGAGYQNNIPQVYSANSTKMQCNNHLATRDTCIAYSGETDLAQVIIDAIPLTTGSYTIPDAIDFNKHVILTVSNMQKFGPALMTVSPDCDTLLIAKNRSEWIDPPPILT